MNDVNVSNDDAISELKQSYYCVVKNKAINKIEKLIKL